MPPPKQNGGVMRREYTTKMTGQTLKLEANAAAPYVYKAIFKKNLFAEFETLQEKDDADKTSLIDGLTFTFAMMAEKPLREVLSLTIVDFYEFLTRFETIELVDEDLVRLVTSMWAEGAETSSEAKNLQSPQ